MSARDIHSEENPYVFPPFALIFPVLKFVRLQTLFSSCDDTQLVQYFLEQ